MANMQRQLSRRDTIKLLSAGALSVGAVSSAAPARAARQEASTLEGDVSVWYFPFGVGVEELYDQFRQEFEEENPGVSVSLELLPWADRYPKMLTAAAAGEAPDILFMTTDAMIRFVEAGALEPLDDLVSEEAWEGFSDRTLDQSSYQGSRWYLPVDQEVSVWLYNKSIMEMIDHDPETPPATWDDLREVCQAVEALDQPDLFGWGYAAGSSTLNTTFYPFLYQAGGRPISEDGSEPTFNSDAGVEALEFIVELFDRGWAPPEWLSPIEDPSQDPFYQERQAVSIRYAAAGLTTVRELAPDLPLGLTPTLSHKEMWGFGAMRSWAISSNVRDREAAGAFLDFLARPENMLRHNEQFGTFPTKEPALEQAFLDDPDRMFLREAAVPYTFDEQKHKYGRDLMPLVIPEIQAAILQQKTPQQALDDAADQVHELFSQG